MRINKVFLQLWTMVYYYNNAYILWLKRNVRKYSNAILLLSSPYIIGRFCVCKMLEPLFAIFVYKRRQNEKKRSFNYEMAIVSIAKNEGAYVKEWIEYHRLVGIDKFYFYDNESEDDTLRMLQPYIDSGIVTYTLIKGIARQLDAYNDAIKKHKDECRYMAFIDLDEYLKPTIPFKPIYRVVDEILEAYGRGGVGVGVNWAVFGTSGHKFTPKGLTVLNFIKRGNNREPKNAHIKTIANPREISYYISPHYPLYKLGAYSVNETGDEHLYVWFSDKREYKNLRINHYYTKSEEQYLNEKVKRGLGDRVGSYNLEKFKEYNLNEEEDRGMEVYANKLKENMKAKVISKKEETNDQHHFCN